MRGVSGYTPVAGLVERWVEARIRTFMARATHGEAKDADYWTELCTGTDIAREVASGRWVVVAELLRHGAVTSWAQVAEAIDLTETDARDGFARWLSGQVDLYENTGSIGLTPAGAEALQALAETVEL